MHARAEPSPATRHSEELAILVYAREAPASLVRPSSHLVSLTEVGVWEVDYRVVDLVVCVFSGAYRYYYDSSTQR
jgi:hypothetical protein